MGLPAAKRFDTYGENTATSSGTTVTANATPHAKGAWQELTPTSGLAFDISAFKIELYSVPNANTTDAAMDIGIGAPGSEIVIARMILIQGQVNIEFGYIPWIRLGLAAGTRVHARIQSNVASVTIICTLRVKAAMKGGAYYSICDSWGYNEGDSGGTAIDPGGITANQEGAWVEIATAANFKGCKQLLWSVGRLANGTLTTADWLIDIGVGANPDQKVVVPDMPLKAHTSTDHFYPGYGEEDIELAAGQSVWVRAQCSIITANDRIFDIVLHALR